MEHDGPEKRIDDAIGKLENLKNGIREISHEINNPLGIIRMAVYFLQTTHPTEEKRKEYFKVIDEGLGRIEHNLQQLKALRDDPATVFPKFPLQR